MGKVAPSRIFENIVGVGKVTGQNTSRQAAEGNFLFSKKVASLNLEKIILDFHPQIQHLNRNINLCGGSTQNLLAKTSAIQLFSTYLKIIVLEKSGWK